MIFLLYALATAIAIMGIGVAIGERSIIGMIAAIAATFIITGIGFKTKAKMRAQGKL